MNKFTNLIWHGCLTKNNYFFCLFFLLLHFLLTDSIRVIITFLFHSFFSTVPIGGWVESQHSCHRSSNHARGTELAPQRSAASQCLRFPDDATPAAPIPTASHATTPATNQWQLHFAWHVWRHDATYLTCDPLDLTYTFCDLHDLER